MQGTAIVHLSFCTIYCELSCIALELVFKHHDFCRKSLLVNMIKTVIFVCENVPVIDWAWHFFL